MRSLWSIKQISAAIEDDRYLNTAVKNITHGSQVVKLHEAKRGFVL